MKLATIGVLIIVISTAATAETEMRLVVKGDLLSSHNVFEEAAAHWDYEAGVEKIAVTVAPGNPCVLPGFESAFCSGQSSTVHGWCELKPCASPERPSYCGRCEALHIIIWGGSDDPWRTVQHLGLIADTNAIDSGGEPTSPSSSSSLGSICRDRSHLVDADSCTDSAVWGEMKGFGGRMRATLAFGATFAMPAEADTQREAARELICSQVHSEDVLADLVRTFFPELGFKVVSYIDEYLEMIEEGCKKTISYDPAKLMDVACREIKRHWTAGSTRREMALCARVEELATEIRKGLPGFNRTWSVKVRTLAEQVHALAIAARCNHLLEEFAGLLGIRRDRIEKLYERSCSRVELTPTYTRVNFLSVEVRDFQPRRNQLPGVVMMIPPEYWYRQRPWERYCKKFDLPCDLTWEFSGVGWLGNDEISDLLEDWPKQHLGQPFLDELQWKLGGLGLSPPPPLVERMRAVASGRASSLETDSQ